MKQIVPFYKEIVFENKIANLISVSLEHNERACEGEISGEFILYGTYKSHNDTTEVEDFQYNLPFTAMLPDDIDINTVTIDISNFNYEQIEENVLRVDIEFIVEGKEAERQTKTTLTDEELDAILEGHITNNITPQPIEIKELEEEISNERKELETIDQPSNQEITPEVPTTAPSTSEQQKEEYITYHVHVVSNKDSIESIIKTYNVNIELLKEYNDIKELKIGDKVLIPEYIDE